MKNIDIIDHAAILPSRKNDFGGGLNGKVLFGVYDEEKKRHFSHQRGNTVWEDLDARKKFIEEHEYDEKLNGNWLYAGPLFFHFGHFISESITRLWAYKKVNNIEGVIFTIPPFIKGNPSIPEYMIECLKILDIDTKKIKLSNKFIYVEKLYIPKQGSILGLGPKPWYDGEITNLNLTTHKEKERKNLFLSRKNYKNNGRVMGMGYFEEVISENCTIIEPEKLSLKEQLLALNEHNTIVFEEGSSLHLLDLISCKDKKIILIRRREGESYLDQLVKNKCNNTLIYDKIKESPLVFPSDQRHNICSRLLNPESLFQTLKEYNLVNQENEFNLDLFKKNENEDIMHYLKHKASLDYDYFR